MPNSSLHISFARDAASALDHPMLNSYQGSYLLGSTAPDIRNLAGWDRYTTHFFDLARDEPGKGVEGLFKHHPELAEAAKLGHETRAFVAGYISHLVTDERWIASVYRPFFGKSSPLANDPMGNVLDRVLQFHLDRTERDRIEDIDEVLALLKEGDIGVRVSFIEPDLLRRWRDVMCERAAQELGWEHLARFARKALPDHLKNDGNTMEAIIRSAPSLLEKVRKQVPSQVISTFRGKAIGEFVKIAGEYLG